MRIQTDQEFQQNKIMLKIFSTKLLGGKAFTVEQKICEFKKILFKSKNNEKRKGKIINSNGLINKATSYLNKIKSVKYGLPPEEVESESMNDKHFTEIYDFHRLVKVKEDEDRRERSDKNKDARQRKKLREPLDLGESCFILPERLK